MKIAGTEEVLYKHAFSQHVNVKARSQSKKVRDTDFLVYDSMRTEDRIVMGRPGHVGLYRNGEYHAV
jgi:ribosomal protein L35